MAGIGAVAWAHDARDEVCKSDPLPATTPTGDRPPAHPAYPITLRAACTTSYVAVSASPISAAVIPRTRTAPELLQRRAAAFAAVARKIRPRCFCAFDPTAAEVVRTKEPIGLRTRPGHACRMPAYPAMAIHRLNVAFGSLSALGLPSLCLPFRPARGAARRSVARATVGWARSHGGHGRSMARASSAHSGRSPRTAA